MAVTRVFVDGRRVALDLPQRHLPLGVAVGVLTFGAVEVEVTTGAAAALDHYLIANATELTDAVTLSSGVDLQTGAFGGDPAEGTAFALEAGPWYAYGYAPPGVRFDTLVRHLAEVEPSVSDAGLALRPHGGTRWSSIRQPQIAQLVPPRYLLTVTRATGARPRRAPEGRAVRGGQLYRSDPRSNRSYLVLDTGEYLGYFLPTGAVSLDAIAADAAEAEIRTAA